MLYDFQTFDFRLNKSLGGGIGRRVGLKIQLWQHSESSSLSRGTNKLLMGLNLLITS